MDVNGNDVYGKLKFESGAHRVQRVPDTERPAIHTGRDGSGHSQDEAEAHRYQQSGPEVDTLFQRWGRVSASTRPNRA